MTEILCVFIAALLVIYVKTDRVADAREFSLSVKNLYHLLMVKVFLPSYTDLWAWDQMPRQSSS